MVSRIFVINYTIPNKKVHLPFNNLIGVLDAPLCDHSLDSCRSLNV